MNRNYLHSGPGCPPKPAWPLKGIAIPLYRKQKRERSFNRRLIKGRSSNPDEFVIRFEKNNCFFIIILIL
jgi:hypothetical protein